MANKRFIDFPIATTVGDNDIILIWQGGANKQTTKATILSGVPDSLNDLTDVTISGLTNGQILRYDSVTGQWENTDQGNLDLNDLNDVTIVSPTNGQVLVYNSSTSKWENSSGGYVPYVGAITTVDLGLQGLEAGYVRFDTSIVSVPDEQGLMYWDASRSTVALIMNGTLQHIGQDTFFYVKNSTGSSIPKGTCVRFAGTDGASGHLLITPFLANGSVPSTYFLGVTAETITNGSFGQVMHFGELEGINTSSYTAGALLYASTTVAGAFQTTAPVAPNNIVLVAAAVNSKNNGAIVVRPTYGSNINNDEGVKITSPTTGDLLQLQAGGLWENKTIDAAGIVTKATNQTITGVKTFSQDIIVNGVNVGRGGGNAVENTSTGNSALSVNTTGSGNTANGSFALFKNTSGGGNTALGTQSLTENTTGSGNTGLGWASLYKNTSGSNNSALGYLSLYENTTGQTNVGIGFYALFKNTTGNDNTALGYTSGAYIADGSTANSISNNSIYIGAYTKALANNQTNQIVIGHNAIGGGSNTVVIGNSSILSNRFFGTMRIGTINNGVGDFITTDANGVLTKRTGAEVRTDIGAGTVTSVAALTLGTSGTDLSSTVANGTTTPVITLNVPTASATNRGALSSADWSTFNAKQNALTLTTTGTSGAATLVGATLNIPQYQAALTNPVTGTGVSGRVTFWNGTNSITSDADLLFNGSELNVSGIKIDGSFIPYIISTLAGSDLNIQFPVGQGLAINNNGAENIARISKNNFSLTGASTIQTSTGNLTISTGGGNGNIIITPNGSGTTTINSNVTASSFIRSGGTSSQYLMADGSVSTLSNPVTGTGTTNYLPKFTGSTTIGNSLFTDNGTIAGVGNALTGNARFNILNIASNPALSIRSTNNLYEVLTMTFNETNDLFSITNKQAFAQSGIAFGTNNTQRMLLDVNGNLGLGVTPSAWSTSFGIKVIDVGNQGTFYASDNDANISFNQFFNGTNAVYKTTGTASRFALLGNEFQWRQAPSGTAGNAISFTQAMTLFATGNLLVGSPSPISDNGARLQVSGTAIFTGGGTYRLTINGTSTNTGLLLRESSTDKWALASASNSFLIYNEQNASSALTINSSNAATFSSSVTAGGPGTFQGVNDGTAIFARRTGGANVFALNVNLDSSWTMFDHAAGSYTAGITQKNGNVGIGTPSPNSAAVDRALTISGTSNSILEINYGSTRGGYFYTNSINTVLSSVQSVPLLFNTADIERMRITSGGDIRINYNPGGANGLYFNDTTNGAAMFYIIPAVYVGSAPYNSNRILAANSSHISFEAGGSERMRITSGGEVLIGNTDNGAYNLQCNGTGVWGAGAYVNGSDRNIKDNIATIEKGLEYIQKMNPVKFRYKPNYTRDHSMQTGFIAQELQEVFASEDYLSGLVQQGVHLSVAYQNLLPVLVKAIQELKQEIDTLKN